MGVVTFVLPLKPVTGNIKQKILLIDYLGAFLTLGGCVLVLLPLIWVRLREVSYFLYSPCLLEIGRVVLLFLGLLEMSLVHS